MANKSNCPDDMDRFQRQRILVVKLKKVAKSAQSGSKSFWKFCKHMLFRNVNNTEEKSFWSKIKLLSLTKGRFTKFSMYTSPVLPNHLGYSIGR